MAGCLFDSFNRIWLAPARAFESWRTRVAQAGLAGALARLHQPTVHRSYEIAQDLGRVIRNSS